MISSLRTVAILVASALSVALLGEYYVDAQTSPVTLPPLHASGALIVDNDNRPVVLRGCNLGNWLLNEMWMMGMVRSGDPKDHWHIEQLLEARFGAAEKDRLLDLYRQNWITQRDFDIIKSWGFNVVRLPFYYDLLEDDSAPGQLRPRAFKWLDRAIEMAAKAGIYVIVDMHGAPGGQSKDQCTGHIGQNKLWETENRKRAAFLWKSIAEHYRDNPTVAAYDLLNEPYGNYKDEPPDETVVATMGELIQAVREVDQKHLIFCAGTLRGIWMYGSPASHGWEDVGYTEHFYPGLFGGVPVLKTHARFINNELPWRANLLKQWQAPFLAGEFNVVFDKAGGAAMMRRYYDIFASHGWAATMWSYKIVKQRAGCHPNNWYMVTNRDRLKIPRFRTSSKREIEDFFQELGTMQYAPNNELYSALTSQAAPILKAREYPIVSQPAAQDRLPEKWESDDTVKSLENGR